MKVAIPLTGGSLSAHFGHCEEFAVLEVDEQSKKITGKSLHKAPPHEPGALPAWLVTLGVEMIITGGMGQRAQQLFSRDNVAVVVGAPVAPPEQVVSAYLAGTLQAGQNICDH